MRVVSQMGVLECPGCNGMSLKRGCQMYSDRECHPFQPSTNRYDIHVTKPSALVVFLILFDA